MKKILSVYLLLLLATISLAQPPRGGGAFGLISGSVIDSESQEPVAYATITIKNVADSTVITGALTDESGMFAVKEIPPGEVIAEVSFIGYDAKVFGPLTISPQSPRHDLGTVTLGVDAAQLDAVVVEGIGSAVRYEIDKKVYDVDKFKAAEGGTAKDVLEQIPSVTIDSDQNIQLRGGQNVRVLINGRPSSFSLQTLLEQVPQKSIQEIEIITNPSAKYDAEGDAGIINIILKENKLEGVTYGVNGQWGTENKWNGGANAAIRTAKWNLTGSYNYNRFRDNFFRDNERTNASFPNILQIADEDRDFVRSGHFARLGVDHYFNAKNTLFLSAAVSPGNGINNSINDSDNVYTSLQTGVDAGGLPTNIPLDFYTYNRLNNSTGERFGYDLSAAFQHDFGENPAHNLLFDFSYSESEDENDNNYSINQLINNDGVVLPGFSDFDSMMDNGSNIKISADYTNPFDGKQKLELGYKSTLDSRDQDFTVKYNSEVDDFNTGVFDFDQDVHAGYFTYQNQVSEKVGLKGGLRAEQTMINSNATGGQTSTYEDDYLSLFPTASASFKIGEKTQLTSSYSRRINRPGGRQLNPFADRTDPNNRFQGNNSLRPEFTNSFEVGANHNWKAVSLDGAIFSRFVTDHIRYYREFDLETNVNTISFRNVAEMQVWGAETSLNISPPKAKWMTVMLSGNYNYGKITELGSNDQLLNASTSVFNGRIMNNLNFGKGWGGQISANYQSPFDYYQGRLSSMWGLNLSANKGGLFKGKGSVYINARDVFNTFGLNLDFEDDNQSQNLELDWPSQMMFVGFNMNFGKMKKPGKRKMERREERGDQQPGLGF